MQTHISIWMYMLNPSAMVKIWKQSNEFAFS